MPELLIYQPLKFQGLTSNNTPVECGRYQSEDQLVGTINVEVWGVRRGGNRDTIHGVREIDFKKIAGTLTVLRNTEIVPVDAKGTISAATFSISAIGNTGGAVMLTGVNSITIDWFVTINLKILK